MTKTDDIGVWQSLGTVLAQYREWAKFSNQALDANATIRVSCQCDNWKSFTGRLLIRPVYSVASGSQVGQAVVIYPQQDIADIVEIPIPNDFLERNITFRYFEVKLFGRYRKHYPLTLLTVEIEELLG